MKQKNANESLNVLKGIASLLVVLIHAPLAGPFGQYIIAVARSGVALFFLLSGYYMCSDDFSVTRVRAKRKLLHICNLALWANLFYLIWGVFVRYVGTGVSSVREWFQHLLQPYTLVRIFVFHEDVLAGHLWLLNALIVCYLLVLLCGNLIRRNFMLLLSISLLFINFFLMNLFPHISGNEIAMVVCRNGWFYGIPVFLLGVHLRKIIYCGIHPKVWLLKAVGMVSFILIGIERLLVGYSQLYFGNMLLLVSFFLLCINNPTVFNLRWLQKIGDTYSTDLYIKSVPFGR